MSCFNVAYCGLFVSEVNVNRHEYYYYRYRYYYYTLHTKSVNLQRAFLTKYLLPLVIHCSIYISLIMVSCYWVGSAQSMFPVNWYWGSLWFWVGRKHYWETWLAMQVVAVTMGLVDYDGCGPNEHRLLGQILVSRKRLVFTGLIDWLWQMCKLFCHIAIYTFSSVSSVFSMRISFSGSSAIIELQIVTLNVRLISSYEHIIIWLTTVQFKAVQASGLD